MRYAGPVLRVDRGSLQPSGLRHGPVVSKSYVTRIGKAALIRKAFRARIARTAARRPKPTQRVEHRLSAAHADQLARAASSGAWVAATTTAAPTVCHIDDTADRAAAEPLQLARTSAPARGGSGARPRSPAPPRRAADDAIAGARAVATGRRAAPAASDRRRRPSRSRPRSRRAPRGSPGPVSQARPSSTSSGTTRPSTTWANVAASCWAAARRLSSLAGRVVEHVPAAGRWAPRSASGHHRRRDEVGHDRDAVHARALRDTARAAGDWTRAAAAIRSIAMPAISGSSTSDAS